MKKVAPKYPQLFLILSFFLSYVHSQSPDSCNSPLSLKGHLPFDTTSLHCVPVWASQNFILRYVQGAPNVWNFLLSAPNTNAYISMGFSPNGSMVGSNAIVGCVGADGTYLKNYFLGGKSPNLVRLISESPHQALQIGNSSMIVQSNQIYMAFQLLSNQSMKTSHLIYAVGPMGQLPSAASNFLLSQHREMVSTVLNSTSGQKATVEHAEGEEILHMIHGLLNILGWTTLMPIGAMVARYLRKWDPIWFYAHAIVQTLGFTLGLSGIICGFVLENRIKPNDDSIHKGLGICILILACLQILAFFIRADKTSKVRKYWNWYHISVGRSLMLLGMINVFYGIYLEKAGAIWKTGFGVILLIFFTIILIMEL